MKPMPTSLHSQGCTRKSNPCILLMKSEVAFCTDR